MNIATVRLFLSYYPASFRFCVFAGTADTFYSSVATMGSFLPGLAQIDRNRQTLRARLSLFSISNWLISVLSLLRGRSMPWAKSLLSQGWSKTWSTVRRALTFVWHIFYSKSIAYLQKTTSTLQLSTYFENLNLLNEKPWYSFIRFRY